MTSVVVLDILIIISCLFIKCLICLSIGILRDVIIIFYIGIQYFRSRIPLSLFWILEAAVWKNLSSSSSDTATSSSFIYSHFFSLILQANYLRALVIFHYLIFIQILLAIILMYLFLLTPSRHSLTTFDIFKAASFLCL
jgi:hypothetical protein